MQISYKDLAEVEFILRKIVKPGDIVSFRGSFPIFAPLIRFITRGPYGHSAIVKDITNMEIQLVEALTKVEQTNLLDCIRKDELRFDIYRVKDSILGEEASKIASQLENKGYAWLQILGFYPGLMTGSWTPNPLMKLDKNGNLNTFYCSQLVVYSYYKAAKKLKVPPINFREGFHWSMIDPSSLTFFSDKVEMIFSSIEKARIKSTAKTVIAI